MRLRFSERLRVDASFEVLDGTYEGVIAKDVPDEKFCIPFLRAQDMGNMNIWKQYGSRWILQISDR